MHENGHIFIFEAGIYVFLGSATLKNGLLERIWHGDFGWLHKIYSEMIRHLEKSHFWENMVKNSEKVTKLSSFFGC